MLAAPGHRVATDPLMWYGCSGLRAGLRMWSARRAAGCSLATRVTGILRLPFTG